MKLKLSKLAAMGATLSALPQTAESFTSFKAPRVGSAPPLWGTRVAVPGSQISKASGDSHHRTAGSALAALGAKNTGDDESINEYDDFGGQWVGGVPDSNVENPGNFLGRFKKADGDFDANALKVYSYTQQIETGLTELENSSRDQDQFRSKLNKLSSTSLDLLKLLCETSADKQSLPVMADVKDSYLTRLDHLFRSAGDDEGRKYYLENIDRTFSNSGTSKLDSVAGMMLTYFSENIKSEINRNVGGSIENLTGPDEKGPDINISMNDAWTLFLDALTGADDEKPGANEKLDVGIFMRDSLVSILSHYQKMHERQAGLETLSGNHPEATALLQKCLSVATAKYRLNPEHTTGNYVALHFNLLKSQILGKDEDAVSTLEDLYMTMLAHADEHEARFPLDFPKALFVANLDDAYSEFLDELENENVKPSLEHPIAKLFAEADERGIFDDLKR